LPHNHHAEQQKDGVRVDGCHSFGQSKSVHSNHERRADNRGALAVNAKAGQPAQSKNEVGGGKDQNRGKCCRWRHAVIK
jgi:hypothetical protein